MYIITVRRITLRRTVASTEAILQRCKLGNSSGRLKPILSDSTLAGHDAGEA